MEWQTPAVVLDTRAHGPHTRARRNRLHAAERDATPADLAVLAAHTDADTDTHAWSGTVRLAERSGLTVHDACHSNRPSAAPAARLARPRPARGGRPCGVPLLGQ